MTFNLLVVDDKKVFFRMICRLNYFQQSDKYRIVGHAKNGIEALKILRSQEVDVVLTDIKMPNMDGIELLQTINREKLCLCTILLSEYKEFHFACQGIVHGAFDYVVKPVNEDIVRETFDRAYDHVVQKKRQSVEASRINSIVELLWLAICEEDESGLEQVLQQVNQAYKAEYTDSNFGRTLMAILSGLRDIVRTNYPSIEKFVDMDILKADWRSVENHSEKIPEVFSEKVRTFFFEVKDCIWRGRNEDVCRIWKYVMENIEEPLRLGDISTAFHFSGKYFSALFKKDTGINYSLFLQKMKMKRAFHLLRKDIFVEEAAMRVGYADPEYFSRLFKKQIGISPSQVRNMEKRS